VDIDAATEYGVVVAGVKGPQDRYVAEHAIALIMALSSNFLIWTPRREKGISSPVSSINPWGSKARPSASWASAESEKS
jgi:lactate dehydrogenase-like 2-hydroxyacid dehydrogenase